MIREYLSPPVLPSTEELVRCSGAMFPSISTSRHGAQPRARRAHHPMPSTSLEQLDALPVGMVLHAFTNQGLIGHGGFGIVFKAERNELDQTVAIKEYLQSELAVREGETCSPAAARFVRTPRTAFDDSGDGEVLVGFDSHPCIVSCQDLLSYERHGVSGDGFRSRPVAGGSPDEARREGHPSTEADLLAGMRPSVDGLVGVHAAGVPFTNDLVKRDLRMMELSMKVMAGSARAGPEGSRHVAQDTVNRTEPVLASHRGPPTWADRVTRQTVLQPGAPRTRPAKAELDLEALHRFGFRAT